MEIEKFNKEIPDLEGFTIGDLRLAGGEVVGFVLIDKDGIKRYILRFDKDIRVEPYW